MATNWNTTFPNGGVARSAYFAGTSATDYDDHIPPAWCPSATIMNYGASTLWVQMGNQSAALGVATNKASTDHCFPLAPGDSMDLDFGALDGGRQDAAATSLFHTYGDDGVGHKMHLIFSRGR